MPEAKYLFQRKKASFTKKLFETGLNAAAFILLSLKEQTEFFLDGLPSSYPQFKIMKDLYGAHKKLKFKRKTITANLSRLKKQGLVKRDPKKRIYLLTDEGEELVSYIQDRYAILKKPWDKKLRMVIFDIPEKKKLWREWIRQELSLLQFKPLQKSVYIGKYPLPESFYQEIVNANLNQYVVVFTATDIDKKQITKALEEE